MANNVMINLTSWYLVNEMLWNIVCCTAVYNNSCNHKLLLLFSYLHLHHFGAPLASWSLMFQFAKYMRCIQSLLCCMTTLSTAVFSNQLLVHIHPEIQQNIFISCFRENFQCIDEAHFHYFKLNERVLPLQTESQTNELHMVNMIKIPTLHLRV